MKLSVKTLKSTLALCLSLMMLTGLLPVRALADNPVPSAPQKAEYLLDENFSFMSTSYAPADIKASGWDVRAAGGSLSYSYYTWFRISDTSKALPVTMTHALTAQTQGKVTLDFRFKAASLMDGLTWQLRSGSSVAVGLVTQGGNLYLMNGASPVLISAYAANTEYGVRVVADLDTHTVDVYVNGVRKLTAGAWTQSTSALDNFNMETGAAAVGDLYVSPVKIWKGYAIHERFVSTMTGLPSDWTATANGGTLAVEDIGNMSPPDIYGLRMNSAAATGVMRFKKDIQALAGQIRMSYACLFTGTQNGVAGELYSASGTVLQIQTLNGRLVAVSGGQFVDLGSFKTNLWYQIMVDVDTQTGLADIRVNYQTRASAFAVTGAAAGITGMGLSIAAGSGAHVLADDFSLYAVVASAGDSVPVPVPVGTGDTLIGTQSCSMWREGQHLGWDFINGYADRKPLIGFYDEGNPSVADWEIKWMLEHGIGFEMYCWFRPLATVGKAIKTPDLSGSLHDGYFNARYQNQMKFMITWENGASKVADSADFRNNVVPFWMEYYLKNPNYVVVDNKPVIAIYSLSRLKTFFGSVAAVKTEMDYLRQACKDAGFADATLLISYSDTAPATLQECKDAGFDAVYPYSWGSMAGYPEIQESKMIQQRDASPIAPVPVIAMGRDDSAWGGPTGYYATADEFESVATWVKDVYQPSLPAGSIGKKMVLLDNWNEFGEGHFLYPTQQNGFMYLDKLRKVFGSSAAHTDGVPDSTQIADLGKLYPQNRTLPSKALIPPGVSGGSACVWDFNTEGNPEGWSNVTQQLTNMSVSGGQLHAVSTGTDPWMISPDNLGIAADDNQVIRIRMENQTADIAGKIYFTTNSDTAWSESKSVSFIARNGAAGMTETDVPMWTNTKWTGTLKSFRVDPSSAPGNLAFDQIAVMNTTAAGIRTQIDGALVRLSQPPVLLGNKVLIPLDLICSQMGIPSQWNPEGSLTFVRDNAVWTLTPGSSAAMRDGVSVPLSQPAAMQNGSLYVASDFLTSAMGWITAWSAADNRLSIYTSALTWDFNTMAGWTTGSGVTGMTLSGGILNLTGNGSDDAALISPDGLGLDAGTVKRIRITQKNKTAGTQLKLQYITDTDVQWNTAKTLEIPVIAQDTLFREYVLDTSSATHWSGNIRQIRILPADAAGTTDIDQVKIDFSNSYKIIGENLVQDPGMETGVSSQLIPYALSLSYSADLPHDGHQSMKIVKQNNYGSIQFKTGQQVKDTEYNYSAWVRLDPASVSLTTTPPKYPVLRLALQYKLDGVTKQMVLATSPVLSTTTWQKVSTTYTIREAGTVTDVSMFFYTDVPAAFDTYYLDDVEIRPVTLSATAVWNAVQGVSLNKVMTDIAPGKAQQLKATVNPADAANRALIWKTDHPETVLVDQNGEIYGVAEGSATVTVATLDGNDQASCAVTVKTGAYETVTLTVKPDGSGDFLTPKAANDSITDSSPDKRYVIRIYPGIYTDTNWTVKAYTTLSGTDRDTCILKGELPDSAINSLITSTSTVWLKATAGMENLTITARNMRYPVHSEENGNNKNAVHTLKNLYVEHLGNLGAVQYRQAWVAANPGVTVPADLDPAQVWGGVSGVGSHAWGYGSASGLSETFENCVFVSKADGWYVHNRENFTSPQINVINNSRIVSTVTDIPVSIQSLGSGTEDQVIFNQCEFSGTYLYQNDVPWITERPENQVADHAEYTVTLNNSTPIGYQDGHRGRALAITSNGTATNSSVQVSGTAVTDILGNYTTRNGGGGLKGYLYGYWDISGILVGLNSNITVNNTLGRRLGNCTTSPKTLVVTFEDGFDRTITFDEDYTAQSNSTILAKINTILGTAGVASEYNVTLNEYYPQVPDKQLTLTNSSTKGIPRFAAVCFDLDDQTVRLMKPSDPASAFLGIALESMAPGKTGRILTEGIMNKSQLFGFSGTVSLNTAIRVGPADGQLSLSGTGPVVLTGKRSDWASFKGNRSLVMP